MDGREEELLKEYFHEVSGKVEEVTEFKLNAAVRSGMSGPARNRVSRGARISVSLMVVLAVVLLFALPMLGKQTGPHNAQSTQGMIKNTGEFDKYLAKANSNITVSSAIEAGLVQPVSGVTAEQNGFVLTVAGIAADRKGLILLYSLKNNTKQKVRVDSLQFTGSGDTAVNDLIGWSRNIADVPTGVTYGYEVMQWGTEFKSLPDQITLKLMLGEYKDLSAVTTGRYVFGDNPLATLSVQIPLNQEEIAKAGETINVNQTLTIDGQEIGIDKVYIAVSGIYMDYTYSRHNSKQIFSMFNPQFLAGSNGDYSSLKLIRTLTEEGNSSMVFANDSLSGQALELQIDGILALDKEATELVIDTEKQKIIKAPDDQLQMSLYSTGLGTTMILEYHAEPGEKRLYNALMLDSQFTDAAGQVHLSGMIDIPQRKESAEAASIPELHYMGLGSNQYSQPLTFTILSYPKLIKEKISLPIRD